MTVEERRRVLIVIGTRPEAIKMAPVVQALRAHAERIETRVCLTGQHTTMVDQVLGIFGMVPDFDLAIMREGQTLYDVAHGCLDGLRAVVQEWRPDLVLVQGDTATVFFASLVAFFERVRVGHVEAGLRSGDKGAPFPEEMFRRLSDELTDLHFAPTPEGRRHLLAEGLPAGGVHVTGNTVVDALRAISVDPPAVQDPVFLRIIEARKQANAGPLVLLTAHRRESFGAPIREIFKAVLELVEAVPGAQILYPVHPNPEVRTPAAELLEGHPRIHLTGPVGYTDLVQALEAADLVLTDSGGIQEEAPTFGTPVLVLREVTERPEGVEAGVATLVGTDRPRIVRLATRILEGDESLADRIADTFGGASRVPGTLGAPHANPYGDGRAGERIADIVASELTGADRVTTDWVP